MEPGQQQVPCGGGGVGGGRLRLWDPAGACPPRGRKQAGVASAVVMASGFCSRWAALPADVLEAGQPFSRGLAGQGTCGQSAGRAPARPARVGGEGNALCSVPLWPRRGTALTGTHGLTHGLGWGGYRGNLGATAGSEQIPLHPAPNPRPPLMGWGPIDTRPAWGPELGLQPESIPDGPIMERIPVQDFPATIPGGA